MLLYVIGGYFFYVQLIVVLFVVCDVVIIGYDFVVDFVIFVCMLIEKLDFGGNVCNLEEVVGWEW